MARPTYSEVQTQIQNFNKEITSLNNQIDLADNAQELIALQAELEEIELNLMMTEDYMERTISRGRR